MVPNFYEVRAAKASILLHLHCLETKGNKLNSLWLENSGMPAVHRIVFSRFGSLGHKADKEVIMKSFLVSWQFWAFLSASFAALTAIFAKVGITHINADFATFIRTLVILATLGLIVLATGQWQPLGEISSRTYLFLILSGLGTGASWLCYFRALKLGQAAQVASIDKLSVVLVALLSVTFLGEKLSTLNWLGILLMVSGMILLIRA